MKLIKKICVVACSAGLLASLFSGCGMAEKEKSKDIVIWSSGEDYRNEFYLSECQKKFPEYNIVLEYMNTSTIAAKVTEEGENCSCDIIISEEYTYLHKCEDYLSEMEEFDYSPYLDELVPQNHKFTPEMKSSGGIIINPKVLKDHNLSVPTCYQDLLDPQYKNLISMPSPKSSSTGYMFLRQLTNEWGENAAFDYFEKLSENVLQYTSSGSGPVNALIQGEVAVGLGMVAQAVTEINRGFDLEVLFFKEGAPYNMYGNAVLKKSASRKAVMDVFNYVATDLAKENNTRFFPDQVYKDYMPEIEGYPSNIQYGNMNNDTLEEKERLLAKWNFS